MKKHEFLEGMQGWSSHLPLLWQALESTDGEVLEFGAGNGSTPRLHQYCHNTKRKLFTYDSNIEYYREFENYRAPDHIIEYTQNWHEPVVNHRYMVGVLLSDESPGEMRKYNIAIFAQNAKVIVAHDAEDRSDHGYLYSIVKPLFKYHKYHEFDGVGTVALSNFVDVTKWEL